LLCSKIRPDGARRIRSTKIEEPLALAGISAAALIVLGLLFAFSGGLAQQLGSLALLFLFGLWLVFALSVAEGCSAAWRIPLVTLTVFWALGLAVFNLNNNHIVRTELIPKTKVYWSAAGPQLSFETWVTSRGDRDFYAANGVPYPVLIVAARGGGSYALAEAALFLARMQDRCPIFSQHIFAMSTVSGGSIGGAAFAAYARSHIRNIPWEPCHFGPAKKGPVESRLEAFADADLLSPLIGSALFADLLQRFLPFPISGLDRAHALASAIERSWAAADPATSNPFTEAFVDQWDPTSATPSLLINTTEVESGRRRLISPFPINPSQPADPAWFYDPPGVAPFYREPPLMTANEPVKEDLPLSQAAEISARFPWILPAATLPRGRAALHLVDGGYFDNSGIETALDLMEVLIGLRNAFRRSELPPADPRRNFELYLLIVSGSDTASLSEITGRNTAEELSTPVRALLSAREARGELTAQRVQSIQYLVDSGTGPVATYHVLAPAVFNEQDLPLSLGFQLSKAASDIIGAQLSTPNECMHINPSDAEARQWLRTRTANPQAGRMADLNHSNSCQQCIVTLLLTTGSTHPFIPEAPCDATPRVIARP
jgi:hypothetical protein